MKKIFQSTGCLLLAVLFLFSCKKDEKRVIFAGSQNSEIVFTSTAAGSPFTFTKADAENVFGSFSWTNPEFKFNTGPSSQDVTYSLEVKLAGTSDFTAVTSIGKDLSKVFKVKDINGYLVLSSPEGIDLAPGVEHQVEMRIRASIANSPGTFVYSNVISYTINPYNMDPSLWITGSATPSGWTNSPPDSQKFAYDRVTKKHTITMTFTPGGQYKFLTVSGRWQPQWGGCQPSGGRILENPGNTSDPDGINTPAEAGNYLITVDLPNKQCTVVKL